jgi:D-beta-D-heptose 7-phosphate kinase/D-beta-D-heptose 1-phosphate adenosyltransferase
MKVTVVGELCKDVFVYGDSKRLSPEAPVPVFEPSYKTENAGMAGNVVSNILAINPDCDIIGFHQSRILKKTRYVHDKTNHMFLRIDEGESSENFKLTEHILKRIIESDIVIISDYDKGYLDKHDIRTISSNSSFCVLDSKKKLDTYTIKSIRFVKVNETEFHNNKFEESDMSKVIITRGIEGTDYMGRNYPSPKPIQTMDVSGAGDTFTAAFALKYFETKDTKQSIIYANEMASIVVSKRGVTTPL